MMSQNILNQLTLGVGLKDDATFDNFYAGSSHLLVDVLKKAAKGQGEKVIYLYGSAGIGRTHLLQACCHLANQHHLRTVYLPLANLIELSPQILEGLEQLDLVCVDDVHVIAGRPAWEEAFFHAYNRIHDKGKRLIVSANVPPKSLGIALSDVVSRLVWGIVYQLQPLTDDEKIHVLVMRARVRGMMLVEEVARYMVRHYERHMSALFSALDLLDQASLSAQRKLTIPFIKSILKI
jgi:DnaA family protein